MKKIKLLFLVLFSAFSAYAQPQSAGEIYGYNNSMTRGRVKIVGDQLKIWDSTVASLNALIKLKLDSIYTKSDSSYQRSTIKISQMPAVTVDSTNASRVGVKLIQNPTIANTSFGISGTLPAFASTPTVNAAQSGTWNINNVSGTVSLPTGAATSANQTNGNQKVQLVDGGSTGTLSQAEGNSPYAGIIAQGYNRVTDEARYLTVNANDRLLTTDSTAFVLLTNIYARQNDTSGWKKSIKISEMPSITTVSGATANYDSSWTATALTITGLNSMASSATVGWKSDTIGFLHNKAVDMELGVKISFANTLPANDKAVYIYCNPWFKGADGTWYSSSGGTATLPTASNGSYTIASPNDFVLLGVLSYTTQNMVCQRTWALSSVFTRMPDAVQFVVVNFSGAALHSSGNYMSYNLANKVQR